MAKRKKEKNVKVFTSADKAVYRMGHAAGSFTQSDAEQMGMSAKRRKQHQKDGYIEKADATKERGKDAEQEYRLTKKGREKFREETGSSSTAYKGGNTRHDKALREEYKKAQEEAEEWYTEKDWAKMLQEKIEELRESKQQEDRDLAEELARKRESGELSPIDGGYKREDGTYVAIEIVTKNYTQEERRAKADFAEVMGAEYREVDIN